jgi:hypothetical protein
MQLPRRPSSIVHFYNPLYWSLLVHLIHPSFVRVDLIVHTLVGPAARRYIHTCCARFRLAEVNFPRFANILDKFVDEVG